MKKKTKKLFSAILIVIMVVTMYIPSNAETNSDTTYEEITKNEYLQTYAKNRNISYEEAERQNDEDNARIVKEYCEQNNIPLPRSINYDYVEVVSGLTIHYVTVSKRYTSNLQDITYGAHGKVLQDTHSKTFVKDSFTGNGFCQNINTFFNLIPENPLPTIIDDSYSQVILYLDVVAQIEIGNTGSLSVTKKELIDAGFSVYLNTYYRKAISDSFSQGVK